MKKTLILSCFALLGTFSFAQDWQTIHALVPNQTTQSIAIGKGDTLLACSALYNGTALNIKRTNDNGTTLTEEYTGYTNQNFRKIATADSSDFFAIANEGLLIANWGTDEWTTVTMPTTSHLRDIFFFNNDIGYITADAGLIFKTIDGGATWTEMVTEGAGGGSINNIFFTTASNGFICGFNFFKSTTDGGATWTDITGVMPEHPMYQLQEIDFINPNVGVVCGDIGYIYKTTDGGINWVKQTTGTEESIQGIDLISETQAYACGYAATVLGTTDGGTTWNVMSSDQTENYRAIQFNANGGFIVTHLGHILYYELPGASLATLTNIVFTAYPNPTRDLVYFSTPLSAVSVYNAMGQLMIQLASSDKLDFSAYPNGLYFIHSETGVIKIIKE